MDCAEAKLRIESYVADQLSASEKKAMEAHLADCAECRLDGELTRASKSAPTRSLPPAAPPEAAPRQSAGEWTIESIFGSASGSGAGNSSTSPAAAAPEPAADALESGFESGATYRGPAESGPVAVPDVPLPAMLQGPAPVAAASAESPEEVAGNGTPGWQFEPADQKQDATPPEGSLFFAEEALSRTATPAKAKSSLLRVVMWGVGGIVGLGLLGISIWFALTLKPPTPHDSAMLPAPGTPAAADPVAGETPATADPVAEAPAPEHAPVAPVAPEPQPSSPVETALSDVPRAGRPPRAETAPPKQEPAASRPADPAPPKKEPAAPRPAPPVERPLWEPAIREEAYVPPAPPPVKPRPASPTPETTTTPPAADPSSDDPPPATAPPAQTPAVWPKSAPGAQPPPETTPAPDPIQRPIDRLHLATLAAEQNADLQALQKLKETWRSFMRTSVGPDRARAKRELGDCLWAIQTLTTRTSDQKAALVAYRDYLLNAPAGGADARTVARMRQLEDALAESR